MVEMMVTIFLTMIILGVTGTTMVLGLRGSRTSMVRTQNTQDASIILERVTKPLRMAIRPLANPPTAPFVTGGTPATGTSTDVTFYGAINTMASQRTVTGPTKYRFYLDTTTGNLVEQITPAKPTGSTFDWPASTTVTYTIGTGLTKTQSIFTYYDQNNSRSRDAGCRGRIHRGLGRIEAERGQADHSGPAATVLVNKVDLPNHLRDVHPPHAPKGVAVSRFARRRGDRGFAMIMVIGSMAVLTIFVTGALTFAMTNIKPARHDQDWQAALAAAQAGVDDYMRHLEDNDSYWSLVEHRPGEPGAEHDQLAHGPGGDRDQRRTVPLPGARRHPDDVAQRRRPAQGHRESRRTCSAPSRSICARTGF